MRESVVDEQADGEAGEDVERLVVVAVAVAVAVAAAAAVVAVVVVIVVVVVVVVVIVWPVVGKRWRNGHSGHAPWRGVWRADPPVRSAIATPAPRGSRIANDIDSSYSM